MKKILNLLKKELEETELDFQSHKMHLSVHQWKKNLVDETDMYRTKIKKIKAAIEILS